VLASPTGLRGQGSADPAQNVMAGSRVFGAKGCGACHAINGLGGDIGPGLANTSGERSYYDLAAAMWNHLPSMVEQMRELGTQRPRLSSWEAGDLIAFLFWLSYFDPAGSAEQGERLFAEKRCIACHQVEGVGGVTAPSLDFLHQYGSPIQVAATLWNHGPSMTEAMRALGVRRPAFTSAELVDLIAYLRDASPVLPEGPIYVLPGRVVDGRRGFTELGCVECPRQPGQGGGLGPDLGARGRQWSLLEFASAMWNKAPAMTSVMAANDISSPQLQPSDMANIVAFLSSVQYFSDAGSSARGPRRIRAKGCLECHTMNGPGEGRDAGDLARMAGLDTPAAVIAAMWNHTLITEAESGRQLTWPMFTAGEMADLAAFFQASAALGSGHNAGQ
jgi:mono/diheme cytochrome c family protein